MNIIYLSGYADERSIPNESALVYGGHTYCVKFENNSSSYLYEGYLPEYQFYKWLRSGDSFVGFWSERASIGLSSNSIRIYGTSFLSEEYHGVNKINNGISIELNGSVIMNERISRRMSKTRSYSDLNEDFEYEADFGIVSSYVYDKSVISLGVNPVAVRKIDDRLNIYWEKLYQNGAGGLSKIYQYKDSSIVSLGETGRHSGKSQIVSLHNDIGEENWLECFDYVIEHCILLDDRVYLSGSKSWTVIDAGSGSTLLYGTVSGDDDKFGALWSDGKFLYIPLGISKLRIMDFDSGNTLHDIEIPYPFVMEDGYPKTEGQYIYYGLSVFGIEYLNTFSGLLTFSKEDVISSNNLSIEVEEKSGVNCRLVENNDLEYYEIAASCEEMGDVLRFTQIEVMTYAQINTYNIWGNMDDDYKDRVNKKFNGDIVVKVDRSKLKNPMEDKLDLMVELLNKHFEEYKAPGSGRSVEVSWEWC